MTRAVPARDRKLGRRSPKNAPALRLATILTGVVPAHPAVADHLGQVVDWQMLGNDRYGDCGPVSVANSRAVVTRYLTGVERYPTLADVLDLYRRSGNPDFDPVTGAGDNGVDMQTMCEAVAAGGIAGVTAVAFAKVDVTSLDEVRAAISIFGYLLLGADLQVSQQRQTADRLWDYAPSGTWGGHAVLAGRYTSATAGPDVGVVTWAEVVDTTDRFWTHQVEEAWVVVWPEHLGTAAFQEGVDLTAFANAYRSLTGRVLPLPAPTPPTSADATFAAALRQGDWVDRRHSRDNRRVATAARAWLDAKGL